MRLFAGKTDFRKTGAAALLLLCVHCVIFDADCETGDVGCDAVTQTVLLNTFASEIPTLPVAGPALWYRADNFTSTVALGGGSLLNDLTGTGRDAFAVLSSAPASSTISGRSVITFDGTNDDLQLLTPFPYTTAMSMFLVAGPSAIIQSYWLGSSGGGASPSIISQYSGLAFEWYHINSGTDRHTLASSASGLNIMSVRHEDGGALTTHFNGTEIVNSTSGTTLNGFELNYIGSANGSTAFTQGDFAELIIYNAMLSDADRLLVECYLAERYSITTTGSC